MIKIFFIYLLTLLFKNYCIYYNKTIYLNEFKDYSRTNLSEHSNVYCVNNIDNTKKNPLIYFEIINM